MAGVGPAPKKDAIRRNKRPEFTQLQQDGEVRGTDLPEGVLGEDSEGKPIEWHPMTRRWWENWRTSPQATRMLSDPDWDYLLDTALIHHNMWKNGRWDFASEVRLRVAKFGATPDDRNRLRAEIITVPEVGDVRAEDIPNLSAARSRRKALLAEEE